MFSTPRKYLLPTFKLCTLKCYVKGKLEGKKPKLFCTGFETCGVTRSGFHFSFKDGTLFPQAYPQPPRAEPRTQNSLAVKIENMRLLLKNDALVFQ